MNLSQVFPRDCRVATGSVRMWAFLFFFVFSPLVSVAMAEEKPKMLPNRVADDKTTEGPVGTVHRTRHIPSFRPGFAAVVGHYYRGAGLVREEIVTEEASSDLYIAPKKRTSKDNGKTWSRWEAIPDDGLLQGELYKADYDCYRVFDPANKKIARITLQRIFAADIRKPQSSYPKYWDHSVFDISDDDGKTFTNPHRVPYEKGADFDPRNWGNNDYLEHNKMYSGYNFIFDDNGHILYSAVVAMPHEEDGKTETVGGIRIFRGKWDTKKNQYNWESPAKFSVSKKISGRGLIEPFLVKLNSGTIYLDMRGSTDGQPKGVEGLAEPRHWHSFSKDGGNTWAPVSDLKFDTGEPFWAPSTFAKLVRSSKNGKLYWIGNISFSERPSGNWPRMPLYIAEFDEDKIALKKDSLTIIANKEETDICPRSQYSNFSLLENRETGTIELYLTRYGEKGILGTPAYYESDVFKYEITLK